MLRKIGRVLVGCLGLAGLWALAALPSQAESPASQADLRINEIMADNVTFLQDPDEPGEFPDWFELYNSGVEAVSLDGLTLSDDPALPTKYTIPTGLSIPAGQFMLFYADDDGKQGARHTNFKLSAAGENLGLYSAQGTVTIDTFTFGLQTADVSMGRQPDGAGDWRFLGKATPGATNSILAPAILNVQRNPLQPTAGVAVDVIATITDNGTLAATLYYTMPGTGLIAIPMTGSGNNTYTAQLPAQADGTLISYFVGAKDNDNQTTTSPTLAPLRSYKYLVGYQPPTVVINEFMADNKSVIQDPGEPGDFPDWIELYNSGTEPVSLDNLYLSDEIDNPTLFPLPTGLTLAPGAFLLLFADASPEQGPLHTNFKINDAGEHLGLYGAVGSYAIDAHEFARQPANTAYGHLPDGAGGWQMLVCPSPDTPNIVCDKLIHLPILLR
jgi:hypothetical protein